jgi:hypothetical protein
MTEEQKKTPPTKYWTVLPSSTDWGLFVVDPKGRHGAYVKGDGSVHIWYYEHEKENMSEPSPTRTWFGDGQHDFIDEDAEYRMIDIDDEIIRLLALRETAIRHFEANGGHTAREEWYYGKPLVALETIPARSTEAQAAIFASFEQEERVERIKSYTEIGVAEEDIDKISSIEYSSGTYTIRLNDKRSWTVQEKQESVE